METLCSKLGLQGLKQLCDQLAAADLAGDEKVAALDASLEAVGEARQQEAAQRVASAQQVAASLKEQASKEKQQLKSQLSEWSEEEVRMLRRALDRFPAGTGKRWEVVQAYVRTRTVDEILDMVKHGLKAGKFAAANAETFVVAKKRQANLANHAEADLRECAFTDVQVNLKGDAARQLEPSAAAAAAPATPVPAAATNGSAAAAGGEEWSEAQVVELVKALKVVTKDVDDRWKHVAELVPGKSKADCFKKFKAMKEAHRSGKKA